MANFGGEHGSYIEPEIIDKKGISEVLKELRAKGQKI